MHEMSVVTDKCFCLLDLSDMGHFEVGTPMTRRLPPPPKKKKNLCLESVPVLSRWLVVAVPQPGRDRGAQLRRHLALKAACDATKSLRPNGTLDYLLDHPVQFRTFIYDDDYKLIYCFIPKVMNVIIFLTFVHSRICRVSKQKVYLLVFCLIFLYTEYDIPKNEAWSDMCCCQKASGSKIRRIRRNYKMTRSKIILQDSTATSLSQDPTSPASHEKTNLDPGSPRCNRKTRCQDPECPWSND